MSLYNRVISGAKWTTLDSVFSSIIQIVRVYVLTKLLSPHDFGIMALVMVVTGFSSLFIDFGISSAVIFKKENTDKELSTLFWVNVFLGVITFGFVFLLRDIFSLYVFHEKVLSDILKLVSFVFLINGFSTQFNALLRKHLKFQFLALTNILATLTGFIVTVVLAYNGEGVYSLVFGYISQSLIKVIFTIVFGLKFHKPKFYFKLSDIKFYLSFGGYQMSERIISYLAQYGDNLLIGAFLSVETLGLYNVAKILVKKPIQLVKSVFNKMAFPVFTSIKDDGQLRKWSTTLSRIVYLAICPIMLLLIVFPEFVINSFYGSKWLQAVPFLQLLSILYSIRLLRNIFGPLLLSKGKAKNSFNYQFFLTIIILTTLSISLIFSIIHALYALIFIEIVIIQPLNYHLIMKPVLSLSRKSYLLLVLSIFTPLVFASVITTLVYNIFSNENLLVLNLGLYFIGLCLELTLYYVLNKDLFVLLKTKIMENRFKKITE